MLFSPRISTRDLARLCRRLATSLEAGIDVRTVWAREAKQTISPTARSRFRAVSEAVNCGDSLQEALSLTDDFFPEMFRELAVVGDETGHLAESFRLLAEHYEEQIKLHRILLVASAWPMVELGLALGVIGLFIWIMGFINPSGDPSRDPLGLGLSGSSGLVVYLLFLGIVAIALFLVFQAIRRGMVWTRPIQLLLLRLPVLGRALQNVALARLSWSLYLTLDAGMDIRRALRISLRTTRNAHYTDHVKSIEAVVEAGDPVHEAFRQSGAFPVDFLDAVSVGEQSGRLVESMGLLSRQYREQAEAALKVLTVMGGFGIWMLVAAILIFFIFRFALFYINTISGFLPE